MVDDDDVDVVYYVDVDFVVVVETGMAEKVIFDEVVDCERAFDVVETTTTTTTMTMMTTMSHPRSDARQELPDEQKKKKLLVSSFLVPCGQGPRSRVGWEVVRLVLGM